MKQVLILIAIFLGCHTYSISQSLDEDYDDEDIRKGITFGFGAGFGYSVHAEAYKEVEQYATQEFSGLRGIVFDSKLGLRVTNRFELYGNVQFSPSNTTISPYRSIYYGGTLAYYFKDLPNFSIHAGAGTYRTNIKDVGAGGNGTLINTSLSLEVSNNFFFDLKVLAGKVNKSDLQPNHFGTSEFNISFLAAYKY